MVALRSTSKMGSLAHDLKIPTIFSSGFLWSHRKNAKLLHHFDHRFRSQVTAGSELKLFNFCHRSLASRTLVLGTFPAKKHRQIPKNRPKRKLNQSKVESKWSQVTPAESTVEMVQYPYQ